MQLQHFLYKKVKIRSHSNIPIIIIILVYKSISRRLEINKSKNKLLQDGKIVL